MLENEIDLIEDSMFWFGSKDQQDAWLRIKTALAELGASPNTGSPKLCCCGSVANVHICDKCFNPSLGTGEVITAQLRAGAR